MKELPPVKRERPLRNPHQRIFIRLETERAIVESNRELIELYEEKIKLVIARVWEG